MSGRWCIGFRGSRHCHWHSRVQRRLVVETVDVSHIGRQSEAFLTIRHHFNELDTLADEERVTLELMRQHRVNLVRMACWCLTELAAELFASTPHFAGACMQCGEQGPFIKARSSVERADDAVMGL